MPSHDVVVASSGLAKSCGAVHALRAPRNAIVGFMGPNGAGKTTPTFERTEL